MGCLPLHIDSVPNLRVIHSRKGQKPLKKVVHYYSSGLKYKEYNDGYRFYNGSKASICLTYV